jgi:hypothetical protein
MRSEFNGSRKIVIMFAAWALVYSHLFLSVQAGANAKCLQAPTWVQRGDKIIDGVPSDLNQCQLDSFKENGATLKPNNNLLGGQGDASLFEDISIGGDGDGCQSTENCMKDCQALCCIVPSCRFAVIHREEDTYCPTGCSIYKEDAYYWYCNLYASGSWKGNDDDTTCYVGATTSKTTTCPSITETAYGWSSATYQGLLSLGTSCTKTVRRELDSDEVSEESIRNTVQGALETIRSIFLTAIQDAIEAKGGFKGFGKNLAKVARKIQKGQD